MHDALGSVITPIYQTSTFRFKDVEHGAACFAGEVDDFIYTRINNPTVRELEQTLAILENGDECICTSSGMAAVNAVFFSLLGQVDASLVCLLKCVVDDINMEIRARGNTSSATRLYTAQRVRYEQWVLGSGARAERTVPRKNPARVSPCLCLCPCFCLCLCLSVCMHARLSARSHASKSRCWRGTSRDSEWRCLL